MTAGSSLSRRCNAGAGTPARGGSSSTKSGVSLHRARKASTSLFRAAGEAAPLACRFTSRSRAVASLDSTATRRSKRCASGTEKQSDPGEKVQRQSPARVCHREIDQLGKQGAIHLKEGQVPHTIAMRADAVREIAGTVELEPVATRDVKQERLSAGKLRANHVRNCRDGVIQCVEREVQHHLVVGVVGKRFDLAQSSRQRACVGQPGENAQGLAQTRRKNRADAAQRKVVAFRPGNIRGRAGRQRPGAIFHCARLR